ncbi:MAG: VOC family protein [Candidatus Dormibacteria bacterium]
MLHQFRFQATLPASDLGRARKFYEQQLGFPPGVEEQAGIYYQSARGSRFLLFASQGTPSGEHTQGGWTVDDIQAEVAALRQRGVVFEEYDFPGLKTVDGIAQTDTGQYAWFKDSEGNLLGIVQPAE